MTAVVVAPLAAGDPAATRSWPPRSPLWSALLARRLGCCGLGFVADLLSQPVLVGYLAGVAVIMIIGQLGKVTGVPVAGDSLPAELASFVTAARHDPLPRPCCWPRSRWRSCSSCSWLLPAAARAAVAVLLAPLAVALFDLQRRTASPSSARCPPGCPRPAFPPLGDDLRPAAARRSASPLVGYTDNVLTARAFATRSGDERRREPGVPRARRREHRRRDCPRLPGEQQRQPDRDRRRRRAAAPSCTRWSRSPAWCSSLLFLRAGARRGLPDGGPGRARHLRRDRLDRHARVPPARRGSGAANWCWRWPRCVGVLLFGILYGDRWSRSACRSSSCCAGSPGRTTRSSGYVPGSPACTTSTTTRDAQVPGLLVYRYDSPLFFANAEDFQHARAGRRRRGGRRRSSGSC